MIRKFASKVVKETEKWGLYESIDPPLVNSDLLIMKTKEFN